MSLILNPYNMATSLTLSFVNKVEATGESVNVSGLGLAGSDLLVFTQVASGGSVSVGTPSGFTSIALEENTGGETIGMRFSYKIASGSETTLTAGTTGDDILTYCWIFRGSRAITAVTPNTWSSQITVGNPTLQTVDPTAMAAPVIVFGRGATAGTGSVTFTTASPAFDATDTTDNGTSYSIVGYKIYNTSPLSHSIDMGDDGVRNQLMSGAISVS